MAWLKLRLGNGKEGILDLDDPDNSPRVSGYPVNASYNYITGEVAAAAVNTTYYTPSTGTRHVRRVLVSGTGEARLDFLYGTSGQQLLKWRVYTTPENTTFELTFPDYLAVSSTQILQLNLWNITASAKEYSITYDVYE